MIYFPVFFSSKDRLSCRKDCIKGQVHLNVSGTKKIKSINVMGTKKIKSIKLPPYLCLDPFPSRIEMSIKIYEICEANLRYILICRNIFEI